MIPQPNLLHSSNESHIAGPCGIDLVAYRYGNPEGLPIVMTTGALQSASSRHAQITDPILLDQFWLLVWDPPFMGNQVLGISICLPRSKRP